MINTSLTKLGTHYLTLPPIDQRQSNSIFQISFHLVVIYYNQMDSTIQWVEIYLVDTIVHFLIDGGLKDLYNNTYYLRAHVPSSLSATM